MNVNKLKGEIVEKGMNVETLAKSINIDRSSLYRKLNDPKKITISEAMRIKSTLDITDEEAIQIFFT